MKIEIIDHAKVRMAERGASEAEVKEAVKDGTTVKAKKGRKAKEKLFGYGKNWQGKNYSYKKVKAIYVEEEETLVVITVYVYYGEWEE